MKLHWSPRSPFVRKVMIVAHERGVADRIDCVRTVAATTKPHAELMTTTRYRKFRPWCSDDGTVIYDSPVICEYLDQLHDGPKLFRRGSSERITALRRQAMADGFLDFLVLWRGELARPAEQPVAGASRELSGQEAGDARVARTGSGRSRGQRILDRACRDRLRAVLSRLPLRGAGLAARASAARRVACEIRRNARGARHRAGRRFLIALRLVPARLRSDQQEANRGTHSVAYARDDDARAAPRL